MIADVDIWRAANLVIKQHGPDAALVAAQRADEMLSNGDIEGQVIWKRICIAIGELLREKRGEGEEFN